MKTNTNHKNLIHWTTAYNLQLSSIRARIVWRAFAAIRYCLDVYYWGNLLHIILSV